MTTDKPMPILVIEAKGEIITSNFSVFAIAVRDRLTEINQTLRTDEDFGQAELDAKAIRAAEQSITDSRADTLAKCESLNNHLAAMDDLGEELRQARLNLSKQIDTQKAKIRDAMIDGGLENLTCDRSMRTGYRAKLTEAIKGKRTIETMREAVRIAVAIENDKIARSRAILDEFEQGFGKSMTLDRRNLEVTDPAILPTELQRRFDVSAAQDAQREAQADAARLRAEAIATAQEQGKAQAIEWAVEVATVTPATVDAEDTAQEEWTRFSIIVRRAFQQIKDERARLAHSVNICAAAMFAGSVGKAWRDVQP